MSKLTNFLSSIRKFLTSSHVLHMEAEIAYLRGQNSMLQLQLIESLKPKQSVITTPRQHIPFKPAVTSWDAYLAAEIAKQEQEEDGTHSSGRQ